MDWQTPLALLIVLLAAAGLARQLWPGRAAPTKGCGSGCGSCPSSAAGHRAATNAPLVTLAPLDSANRRGAAQP